MSGLVRILAWLAASIVVALPLVAVLKGWMAPDRWPIRQLAVTAEYHQLDAAQLQAVIVAQLGRGYFDTDPARVRAALLNLAWVEQAEVRKRWPDRLEVTLVEHRARARWGEDRLISDRKILFQVPDPDRLRDLPRLSGPAGQAGAILDRFEELREFLGEQGLTPTRVAVSRSGRWQLWMADGTAIELGREPLPRRRLARALDLLADPAARPAGATLRIDLRYTNGFAVDWRPAPGVPLEPPLAAPVAGSFPLLSLQVVGHEPQG